MIEGPDWNVFGVIAIHENGQREVLGGSLNSAATLAMWKVFVESRPNADVMMCHGALCMRRSKPHWPLCEGKPR